HRTRTDDRGLMIEPAFGAQARDRGTKTVDDAHAAGRRQQVGQPGKRTLARGAETGANMSLVRHLACGAAPQPRGDAFKTGLAGEVCDVLAGDDQFAALAVD